MTATAAPLAGVRVLEAGRGRSVLLLGRLLGDLGAELIPVGARPDPQDEFEQWLAHRDHPVIDGPDLAGLLRGADALICDGASAERSDPGWAAALAPERLRAEAPELIVVRLSEFGSTGPWSGMPATELTLQALAGLVAATGEPTDPVITTTVDLARYTAALSGLLVLLAGLIGRARGAGGDDYDIAEFDGLISHIGTILPSVALTGAPPRRRGNRHGMAAPWNSYPCRDAHVMVCTMGQPMWRRLASLIGQPDLIGDPRFAEPVARVENVELLDEIIASWTAQHTAATVIELLRDAQIPCALIAGPSEVRASTATRERGLASGPQLMPCSPLTSLTPDTAGSPNRAAPAGPGASLPPGTAPLHGLRVLEMGSYTAGPAAARLLAQLGADVLKVEPTDGEGSRRLAQQIESVGYLYFVNNAGKRSCRLDLTEPSDLERLHDLAARADILVTNLAPDTLTKSGMAAEQILARHNLVHCAVSGHGRASTDRSFDTVIQAETAVMALVGRAAGAPRRTAVSSVDVLGSFLTAAAALIGTWVRLRTGSGNSLDVALYDVAVWLTQQAWFADPQRPAAQLLTLEDGTVIVDHAQARLDPSPSATVTTVLEQARRAGVPAAPLHDLTAVVDHPQVEVRQMLLQQRYREADVLLTGDHLQSLRRNPSPLALAPVDDDDPTWHNGAPNRRRTTMTAAPSALAFEDLRYEVKDGVATITIDRAHVRNALRTKTYEELTTAVTAAADDGTVGVIVLTGAGDKAFSAGGDVNDQRGRTATVGRIHLRRLLALGAAMQECGKPIIAAVRGFCVGAGHELHVMCDLTIASSDAKFGQVGPRVGSVPMWGATEMLPRIVGEKKAREMIYLTKLYSAEEAERMGLINQVVEPEDLDEAVDAMCQRLLDASPQSLRIAKTSLNFAIDSMRPAFTAGAEMLTLMYGTEEQGEGAAAFLEKRPPNYRRFRVAVEGSNNDD